MARWLRDAPKTAALGQEKPAARLLGVVVGRRSGKFERTESQQQMLKGLAALKKRRPDTRRPSE